MITVGTDIGSATTKAVLMKEKEVMGYSVLPTGVDCNLAANRVVEEVLAAAGRDSGGVDFVLSTGYGRRAIDFGDKTISEISANARGAVYIEPAARTVIDIGGQDTKVISLDGEGKVENFAMNDRCAAGTGRFIEKMADVFSMDVGALGRLALESREAITLNSTCTVFAESEVISLIARKVRREDIAAAIHSSVIKRVVTLLKSIRIREPVFFSGGGAKNPGLQKALKTELGLELHVPEEPQIVSAIGAALLAQEFSRKEGN
jgi:predicted CoA-substrate-specific enzyme activase